VTIVDERRSLLRNRDFLLLWSGAGVAFLSWRVTTMAYPLLAISFTGSPADVGLVAFAAALPFALVQLPAGAMIDRWDRRRLMIACDIVRCAAVAALTAALLAGFTSLWLVATVAFVEGGGTIFYRLAERSAVRNVVAEDQLGSALAQNEARERVAGLVGRPLGGLLFGLLRWVPFLFSALTYLVSLGALLAIRSPFQQERTEPPGRLVPSIVEGLVWLWRNRFLRVTVLLVAGSNLLSEAVNIVIVVAVRHSGGSPAAIGMIFAVSALGGILGALCAGPLISRMSMRATVVGPNVVWALMMSLIALTTDPVALGAISAAMSFAGAIWGVSVGTYQLQVTPSAMQGRVLAASTLISLGPVALGALGCGLLLTAIGTVPTVLVISALMAGLVAVAVLSGSVRDANVHPTDGAES
jgi:MFS family permease